MALTSMNIIVTRLQQVEKRWPLWRSLYRSADRPVMDPKQSVETTRERRSTPERTFDARRPRRVRSEPSPAALRH